MALMDPIRDLGRTNIANAEYAGSVVSNQDPKKQQRVRIRVPQLHRGIPDDKLPWVRPSNNGGQANAGVGVGTVNVPPVGAKMNFSLPDNDPHNPRMAGSPTTDDVNKDNELLNEDYPGTYGVIDHAGNKKAVNTEKNTITDTHKSGSTTHTDGDGNVSIYAAGTLTLSAAKGVVIAGTTGIKIHTSGPLDLKGSRIDLNGSGAVTSVTPPTARPRPNIPSPADKPDM